MAFDDRYDTRLDNKYGALTTIDIPAEVAAHEPWFNQTLTQVNDSWSRVRTSRRPGTPDLLGYRS